MIKQTYTARKIVASFAAVALAATLGMSGLAAVAPAAAFADTGVALQDDKIDINSLKSFEVIGDQYNLSPKSDDGSIASAMVYSYSVGSKKNSNVLYEGEDYTVAYDWSGIDQETGTGTVTATITGIGDYTGTVTYTYDVVEYVLEVSGISDEVVSFNQNDILQWMADATDNTENYFYQYGTDSVSVIMVPAKSYLTVDTLLEKLGLTDQQKEDLETLRAEAPDGFGTNYTKDDFSLYWFPAQTDGSTASTAGATEVPLVFTFEYLTKTGLESTAGAMADEMADAYKSGSSAIEELGAGQSYVPRTFIGATMEGYTEQSGLGGNRFPTGVTNLSLTGILASEKISDMSDVTDWAVPYVTAAVNRGLMGAYSGTTTFDPAGNLTRGQAFTILYRAANPGSTDTTVEADYADNKTPFADNASGDFYTAAINWAYQFGLTTGNNGRALPNDKITRQELATIVGRYAEKIAGVDVEAADPEAAESCTDWAMVEEYAQPYIKWTAQYDILSGFANANGTKTLHPGADTNREQMAKIIIQTLDLVAE